MPQGQRSAGCIASLQRHLGPAHASAGNGATRQGLAGKPDRALSRLGDAQGWQREAGIGRAIFGHCQPQRQRLAIGLFHSPADARHIGPAGKEIAVEARQPAPLNGHLRARQSEHDVARTAAQFGLRHNHGKPVAVLAKREIGQQPRAAQLARQGRVHPFQQRRQQRTLHASSGLGENPARQRARRKPGSFKAPLAFETRQAITPAHQALCFEGGEPPLTGRQIARRQAIVGGEQILAPGKRTVACQRGRANTGHLNRPQFQPCPARHHLEIAGSKKVQLDPAPAQRNFLAASETVEPQGSCKMRLARIHLDRTEQCRALGGAIAERQRRRGKC